MPNRKVPSSQSVSPTQSDTGSFRARYDALEQRRETLIARLQRLGENGKRHPGYKRALKLLNDTFRKSKLPQRLAVLEAAAWLIDVLERVTMFL